MKNKKKIIMIIFVILIIFLITGIILYKKINTKPKPEPEPEQPEAKDNMIIVGLDNTTGNVEPEPEPEPEEPQTASEWTLAIENSGTEIGNLYIPRTNLNTPVYCKQSIEKMEKMPCFLYTSGGINRPGVTCITGHNRRNGKLFSNNKKIQVGDVFYFRDNEGLELEYTVFKKYNTVSTDTGFLNIETDKPIIALSCCTDASNDDRIIILGRADQY